MCVQVADRTAVTDAAPGPGDRIGIAPADPAPCDNEDILACDNTAPPFVVTTVAVAIADAAAVTVCLPDPISGETMDG